jgi:hypothetical protein
MLGYCKAGKVFFPLLVYIYLNPIAIVISSFVLLNFKHMNTGQAVQPSAAETKKAKRRVSDKKYCHGKKLEVNGAV